MSDQYPTLLHRWFDEVWNQKRTDTIEEMMSAETLHYGLTGPGGPPISGLDSFREFHANFLTAFPDLKITVHDVVSEGDKMACRYTVTGTQRGPLSELEASRVKVEFTGGGMCRLKTANSSRFGMRSIFRRCFMISRHASQSRNERWLNRGNGLGGTEG